MNKFKKVLCIRKRVALRKWIDTIAKPTVFMSTPNNVEKKDDFIFEECFDELDCKDGYCCFQGSLLRGIDNFSGAARSVLKAQYKE